MMTGQVCTYCVADLTKASSQLTVQIDGVEDGGEFNRLHSMTRGSLHDKRDIMLRAFAEGWRVEINSYPAFPPVTTWNGDPICPVHLYEQAEQARAPRTVRMAQWGPRGSSR